MHCHMNQSRDLRFRQRDKIDANANKFMRTTNALIAKFRADLKGGNGGGGGSGLGAEQAEHLGAVADILASVVTWPLA